jgi:hypothetical protein
VTECVIERVRMQVSGERCCDGYFSEYLVAICRCPVFSFWLTSNMTLHVLHDMPCCCGHAALYYSQHVSGQILVFWGCIYSTGQKFGQTMDVSQGCKQALYQYAFWSTWLHAVMPAPHSHGCRLRVSLRAGTWQSLQNCNFTAKNRPVFASICSTQQ